MLVSKHKFFALSGRKMSLVDFCALLLGTCFHFLAITPSSSSAVEFTNLVSFAGTNGATPIGSLLQASDGNIYGITGEGGAYGKGTIFKMAMDGALTTIASFNTANGASPHGGLVQGPDGYIFGTTVTGGDYNQGTVFKFSPEGVLTTIWSFDGTNGASPGSELIIGPNGDLYGATEFGGLTDFDWLGQGVIFRISPEGVFSPLAFLHGTTASYFFGGLVLGTDGAFYGTTWGSYYGGAIGSVLPTLFRVSPEGALSTLATFNGANGSGSHFALVQDANGNLYGAGDFGGTNRDNSGYNTLGLIYRARPDGELTATYSFQGTNGATPRGLLVARDGNIYGVTGYRVLGYNGSSGSGGGTVFRLNPTTGSLDTLVSFSNGESPFCTLVEGQDGRLYGTTRGGGAYGKGTVFRLTVPMAPGFQRVTRSDNQIVFTWTAVAGLTYQLQTATDLSDWLNVGAPITATNGLAVSSDTLRPESLRIYRLSLLP